MRFNFNKIKVRFTKNGSELIFSSEKFVFNIKEVNMQSRYRNVLKLKYLLRVNWLQQFMKNNQIQQKYIMIFKGVKIV
ncbi:unnamed protein product [Paramecium primaurelia]|uniref:Uncharacterized protein n=1 Tax=Paramecium primaurelia TaxID=5886 RepID=A0A8S1QFK4_PARPR|nr:unnamed protein product [Paramecium primaurelia]